MTKINPIINHIKTGAISPKVTHKLAKKFLTSPIIKTAPLVAGAIGITINSLLKDFNKTVEEENYFQLKVNPKTNRPFEPDIFQKAAGINLFLGNDVLVTAPTGTGKTAIAEYVITKNLKDGKRTFYTTPLKALSNEKFLDFSRRYGEENVGLITGDTKVNTDAPIIIMTTEVYRNMAVSDKLNFDIETDEKKGIPEGVKTVIFDELQYLGDIDRGGIWEQSIMFTPKDIQILSLSATIGNNEEINDWIASTRNRKGIAVTPDRNYKPNLNKATETVLINVPSENRHVPLTFHLEHAAAEIKVPRGGSKKEKLKAKKEGARISQSIYAKPRDEAFKLLTRKLNQEGKIPAIYFVFSKKDCRHLLKYLSTEADILTTEAEQKEIEEIVQQYKNNKIYLGERFDFEALKKGYAIHNAGLLPSQKRLVEELFQKKLVKVVLATETLSAGINMPAKTTIISSPRKPSSTSDGGQDKKRNLSANEFHQMAGRAGRRGIDTEGHCYYLSCNKEQTLLYDNLVKSTSNPLESNLNLDYSFVSNYMAEFSDLRELEYILSKSLYTYDPNGNYNPEKLNALINQFNIKKNLLLSEGFITPDGHLTTKGQLIKHLNGYEQIPIINVLADMKLDSLSSAQVAGIIGGLANLEYSEKEDLPQKPFELRSTNTQEFKDKALEVSEMVSEYSSKTADLHENQEVKISSKVIDHLYMWAKLNAKHPNGRRNWKELNNGLFKNSIKDEGSLFKEITMTSDLLKQLIEVAKAGKLYSETEEEQKHYETLCDKFEEALSYIQQEPITETFQ
ncbi:DEAD/DEAH box helicase [bacterium]|nr:DEAD/DEAH box helicase [bacterium]